MTGASACPGCGAVLPEREGPGHAYMTGSPACWAAFGRVVAAEYQEPARWPAHSLTVDAYAVQHPGDGSARAARSVGVHLLTLHFTLERGLDPTWMARVRRGASERLRDGLTWLAPPEAPPEVDVTHLFTGPGYASVIADPHAHLRRAREWAEAAWHQWTAHHDTVARWAEWLLAASPPGFPAGGVLR